MAQITIEELNRGEKQDTISTGATVHRSNTVYSYVPNRFGYYHRLFHKTEIALIHILSFL